MSKKTFRIKNDLLEALDDTIASAQNYAGELYVQMIPIRKIEIDQDNPRELQLDIHHILSVSPDNISDNIAIIAEKESLFSISQSIAEQGVINPILVYKEGDHYKLIAGQRRTLGSILAGKQDIPAKILDKKPNQLQISQLQWIENIEREDLSLLERMNNINKIIIAYKTINNADVTPSKLSKLLGCSLQQAVNYNHILNAPDQVKQLIKSNQIKSIDKAATICKSEPDKQIELINSYLGGASLKELKRLAHSELKSLEYNENIKEKTRYYNLGKTSDINIIKFIIQAITNQLESSNLSNETPYINLNEHNSVLDGYKELITLLEKNIESLDMRSVPSQ